MVVKIRLARFGRRHNSFFNIVVSNARTARGSKPLEVLGTYVPYPQVPIDGEGKKQKKIQLDITRAKYWIGVGAQPTDSAWDLLHKAGLLPMQLHKQRSIWRAQQMDELHKAVADGNLSVGDMIDKSALLDTQFAAKVQLEADEAENARKEKFNNSLELNLDDELDLPDPTKAMIRKTLKYAKSNGGYDSPRGQAISNKRRLKKSAMDFQVSQNGSLPVRWNLADLRNRGPP